MTLDPDREGDDLLDDGFHPSPLGRVVRRGIRPQQRFLIDHVQVIVDTVLSEIMQSQILGRTVSQTWAHQTLGAGAFA